MPDTYCDATDAEGMLRCDKRPHEGGRHREKWVATWARDGSDVRFADDPKPGGSGSQPSTLDSPSSTLEPR